MEQNGNVRQLVRSILLNITICTVYGSVIQVWYFGNAIENSILFSLVTGLVVALVECLLFISRFCK